MRYLLLVVPWLLLGCGSDPELPKTISADQLACSRLQHILSVKERAARQFWPAFSEKEVFGPMVYFTDKATYVLHPNEHIRSHWALSPVPDCHLASFFRIAGLSPDTARFHMNVSFGDEDSTQLYYQDDVGMFSDLEITDRFVPDVGDTDEWGTMVAHELFHQFQRSYPDFRAYETGHSLSENREQLIELYESKEVYRESLELENQYLIQAWQSDEEEEMGIFFHRSDSLRRARHQRLTANTEMDLKATEELFFRMEGGARFMEELVVRQLLKEEPDGQLAKTDTAYLETKYRDYDPKRDAWRPRLHNQYYYGMGYNLYKLAEKAGLDYTRTIAENIPLPDLLDAGLLSGKKE